MRLRDIQFHSIKCKRISFFWRALALGVISTLAISPPLYAETKKCAWSLDPLKAVAIKAVNGNSQAFDQLFKSFYKLVYNRAYRMLGNRDEAQDVAQEVFIDAHRAIHGYRPDDPFSSWILRIATNRCIDKFRRKGNRKEAYSLDQPITTSRGELLDPSDNIEDPNSNEPLQAILEDVLDERIEAALLSINSDFRTVIILVDIDGYTYEEAAQATSTSIGTVRSRIHRGRRLLRQKLREAGYPG